MTKIVSDSNLQDFGQAFYDKLARVATSGSYLDLSDTPASSNVNNAEFSVKGAGTKVASTTANASTDSEVNIVAGNNVTVTPDATNHTITVASTDDSVTAPTNHYSPATDSQSAISASATGATANWGIDVVTGVTISKDAKGHVTGLSVSSGKVPANPVSSNTVTTSGTLTSDTVVMGNGNKTVKASSYTVSNTLSDSTTVIPTGKAVMDKFNELSGAMHLIGTSSTAITDGGTENPTISGYSGTAKTLGNVVLYDGKEFAWVGTAWEQLGDESSYTLKTTTVTAGTGLSGGGALSSNITLNHSNSITAQTTQAIYPIAIDAQGHISGYGTAVVPLTSSSNIDASKLTGIVPAGTYTNTTYKMSVNGNVNGDSVYGTNLGTIYAPNAAGTSGQYLASTGNGTPAWTSFNSEVWTFTLSDNTTVTKTVLLG